MIVFEWIIGILLGAVLLSQLAKRIGAPYPALLALGGAVLAFIPLVRRASSWNQNWPWLSFSHPSFLMPPTIRPPAISKTTGCL